MAGHCAAGKIFDRSPGAIALRCRHYCSIVEAASLSELLQIGRCTCWERVSRTNLRLLENAEAFYFRDERETRPWALSCASGFRTIGAP